MGFLDKLKNKPQLPTALPPHMAFLVCVFWIAGIDQNIPDEEKTALERVQGKLPGSGPDDIQEVVRLFQTWGEANVDMDAVRNLCKNSLNMDQRLFAIANMIEIAMADGTIQDEEQKAIEDFVTAFEVDSNAVEKIVEVMGIKNNFNAFA